MNETAVQSKQSNKVRVLLVREVSYNSQLVSFSKLSIITNMAASDANAREAVAMADEEEDVCKNSLHARISSAMR
ncbi:hypothetical protein EON65_45125 [archaeon]|nr:MAG: hypothetical protein EON65_45125 [archaeon]